MMDPRFQQVALPLKDRLFRVAMAITLCREDAEDIVQETLVRLWRQMQQQDSDTPLNAEAFAVTVCRRLSLDQLDRKEQRNVSLDATLQERAAPFGDPHQQLEASDQISRIQQIIATLPEKQRTAITLRDIEGYTYKEITAAMGISESDVKVNIYRARQRLRKILTANQ